MKEKKKEKNKKKRKKKKKMKRGGGKEKKEEKEEEKEEQKEEENAAIGVMNDAPSAEHVSGGGMKTGGQGSGVGASGGPKEPTAFSTTTAKQVLNGECSAVVIQAVTAAKGSEAGGGTVGADAAKAQKLGSP